MNRPYLLSLLLLLISLQTKAQISAELIQNPDVSEDKICFVFGNDLWLVAKTGGQAYRLSSPVGREANPKFSPDGQTIAFEANYDGNNDIYTLPINGGVPKRVTTHGMRESISDWYADGRSLLYTSSMESGKQRFSQFYKISKEGGLPDKLPIKIAGNGMVSQDGTQIAFTEKSRIFRTWKRYRGGSAPDIYIMDLKTLETSNINNSEANEELPMWNGSDLYYLSDGGEAKRNNIWKYDTMSKKHSQLTFFTDFDIHLPSIGPKDMVFQAGGKLYLMNLSNHEYELVNIDAIGDFLSLKTTTKNLGKDVNYYNISPDGNRLLVEARGDVYTLPKENGITKNISRTSGVFERYPTWSPDGKHIAYFSDKSGEYELTLMDIKTNKERKITSMGPGFRYNIYWSPDSKHVAFVDQTMSIYIVSISNGMVTKVDQDVALFEGGLNSFIASWSKDSRWLSYTKTLANGNNAIFIYNNNTKTAKQVTTGYFNDTKPTFDKEGDHLFYRTSRNFNPIYSNFDNTWVYANSEKLAALALRKDIKSLLAPKNDAVSMDNEEKEDKTEKEKDDKEEKEADKSVKIDFDNIEERLIILPMDGGNYGRLATTEGKLIYVKYPNTGSGEDTGEIKYFDFEEQEEKSIISGPDDFEISADGKSLAIMNDNGDMGIISTAEDQKLEKTISTSGMTATIDPMKEWKQIFNDVWRLERDFFYDKDMHGVDWEAMKIRYGALIDQCVSRYDVNFVIGELIGELNASHTYRGGGDRQSVKSKNTGYLGVDWGMKQGQYYIKRIVKGAVWDTDVRSPLLEAGIDVSEGDYILAVNGIPMTEYQDPWDAFAGLAGKTVELTVNNTNTMTNAKQVLVTTLEGETRLRNLEWIEQNRKHVDEQSNGKIGYIYVPSTGVNDGQYDLVRMFYGQRHKEGLIIDERFNNGGQIPDRFIELLNRKPLAYFKVRDGENWQWPPVGHYGPKAMLINGWSGSGGDAFPDYFRKAGLGKLIGTRTWGGLIGISGAPSLIDGGNVTVPTFRMYNPDGSWFKEGHGVDPDILVNEDPESLAKGKDVQLDRAIKEVMDSLLKNTTLHPTPPSKEDRSK